MRGVANVTNDFTLPACTERVVRRFRRLGIGVSAICENLRNLRILRLGPAFNWRKVRFLLFKGYDFLNNRLEARIAAERIELRINFNHGDG